MEMEMENIHIMEVPVYYRLERTTMVLNNDVGVNDVMDNIRRFYNRQGHRVTGEDQEIAQLNVSYEAPLLFRPIQIQEEEDDEDIMMQDEENNNPLQRPRLAAAGAALLQRPQPAAAALQGATAYTANIRLWWRTGELLVEAIYQDGNRGLFIQEIRQMFALLQENMNIEEEDDRLMGQ